MREVKGHTADGDGGGRETDPERAELVEKAVEVGRVSSWVRRV